MYSKSAKAKSARIGVASLALLSAEPADRIRAERAIAGLYRLAKLAQPLVIWLPCPISGALAASCGFVWLLDELCFVCERPRTINLDEHGRLHCETGQSIAYPSGWGLWHRHGVEVPRDVLERPNS